MNIYTKYDYYLCQDGMTSLKNTEVSFKNLWWYNKWIGFYDILDTRERVNGSDISLWFSNLRWKMGDMMTAIKRYYEMGFHKRWWNLSENVCSSI